MAALATRFAADRAVTAERVALAVADANWFTTENLFREVRRDEVSTLLLSCLDYVNAWQRGQRPWSWSGVLQSDNPRLWRRELILPSGWMKRFPRFGMRPIARAIREWQTQQVAGGRLALVMTYPHYLYLRDAIRPERCVYYNLDDYTLYWPRQAVQVRAMERRAVRESDLTVCVSQLRAEALRAAMPESAARIHHLPHGAPSSMIAEHPWHQPADPPADLAHLPRPLLGYVGSLESRVDWPLLTRLSEAFPGGSIILIGRSVPATVEGSDWSLARQTCLSRPNVHALGWRSQDQIPLYTRALDIALIPYDLAHPFNEACSPTKIMDYMGTGRPIVSTDLPECRLYTDILHVADSPETFLSMVQSILDDGSDDGRAAARHDHARRNTCAIVAERLLNLVLS